MNSRSWFQKARSEKFAIGAFNVANIETFHAVVNAARNLRAPVIVESSPGETRHFGAKELVAIVKVAREETKLPIFLNLDHADLESEAMAGIKAGYDLVHFDGSKLPYEENLKQTKEVVAAGHKKGLLVEAEIEHITGSSEVHTERAEVAQGLGLYTDPVRAREFIRTTRADTLAVFIGNVHGTYQTPEKLDLGLMEKIKKTVPAYFSLHGGSGIPDGQVREAIKRGIVKVNVNTELRVAYRKTLERELGSHPHEVAMYKVMPEVIAALQAIVQKKIEVFGSAHKV
jgi:fructose-bisphosphate aldolase class II